MAVNLGPTEPVKIEFTERVQITMTLKIVSETGDRVEFSPAAFVDNSGYVTPIFNAFERMAAQILEQIKSYINRQEERRTEWKG